MKQVFSTPYYPQGNGCITNVHNFQKICIWKYVSSEPAWYLVVHTGCVVNSFAQNEHSKESAFFLMFGRDVYMPLVQLLNPKLIYVYNDKSLLPLDTL